MKFLSVLCILIMSSEGAKLPSNFKKCNRNQPDLRKCLVEAAQYGISQLDRPYKKLNVPTIEPLEILEISTHVNRGGVYLDERLTNCKIYGLSKTEIKKFNFDLEKKFIYFDAVFPKINTSCHFDTNGTFLGARIFGRGGSHLHLKNFHVSVNLTYNELRRRNKTYLEIATTTLDGKPEGLWMKLENLFNGDQEASERIHRLINNNWSELYDDVKDDYLGVPNQLFKRLAGAFFSKLSLEDLFE